AGYGALMDARGSLSERLQAVPLPHRAVIPAYLAKTGAGRAQCGVQHDAWHDVSELREYCYYVAGVVGEMLTAMFTSYDRGLLPAEAELMRLAPSVGESLQLVNMIRDYQSDNERKRLYFSDSISFDDLLGLATESMESAREFLDILFRYEAQPGIVAFNAFNFSLAERALQNAKSLGHYKLDRSDVRVATQSIRAV
ncbi:MAG: squalene/phytoene synthase family protein, partial [Planctomycetota bacterium]|nr:squalene/phytoene synthase family protein [Planctomycetota bacterium]